MDHPKVVEFAGIEADFILQVCEKLFAHTGPHNREEILFGGVNLRLYVNNHWAGFERYMLIGRDWTVGFNLKVPETECAPTLRIFETDMELFTPHLTGEPGFIRDMTVLQMTASDWVEDDKPIIW